MVLPSPFSPSGPPSPPSLPRAPLLPVPPSLPSRQGQGSGGMRGGAKLVHVGHKHAGITAPICCSTHRS
ncbi:unnamed protein product [Closterium sp. Naga37s-1]|nr:unnamed protein product [Closterium sp. Naga37s-1]